MPKINITYSYEIIAAIDKNIAIIQYRNFPKLILIDAEDIIKFKSHVWTLAHQASGIYSSIVCNHPRSSLHRIILNYTGALMVDHINRNIFDNRKANLRIATNAQNQMNKIGFGKSGFKGVKIKLRYSKTTYEAAISKGGKYNYIGSFASAIEAAKAYDTKAKELFGEFARTNFN